MVCRKYFSTLIHITPPPGLESSFQVEWNFSKRVCFSINFFWSWLLKKVCQNIFHQITTQPRASHTDMNEGKDW